MVKVLNLMKSPLNTLISSGKEEFDTEIHDEEAEKITTVQSAIDYIKAHAE